VVSAAIVAPGHERAPPLTELRQQGLIEIDQITTLHL
jgi:hypothetical protein